MNITIICGRLEPGSDGVGDYSRRLAQEATANLGHRVQLISLFDEQEQTERPGPNYLIRRTKLNYQNQADIRKLVEMIESWNTDAVSLQFVPFAYHPKGLISKFIPFIQAVRENRRLQVMLHETWVRWERGARIRHRLLGQLQRYQILKALKIWQPEYIQTSNPYYLEQLRVAGVRGSLLPIFGNIEIEESKNPSEFQDLLDEPFRPNERRIIFPFNQDHMWQPIVLLNRIKNIIGARDIPIRLIQIGRTHSEYGHWQVIEKFAQENGWLCHRLGPRDSSLISLAFQSCHIGISAGPIHLARKSGAVLSMLEHGIPVLCSHPSCLANWAEFNEPRLVAEEANDQAIESLLLHEDRASSNTKLTSIAEKWLAELAK